MNRTSLIVSIAAASFLLAGCGPEHDVDWYKTHDSERQAKLQECQTQAESNQDADCKNAREANTQINLHGKEEGKTRDPAELLKTE
jgi:predicted Fe-S protein YdhL (DUF1289 family)